MDMDAGEPVTTYIIIYTTACSTRRLAGKGVTRSDLTRTSHSAITSQLWRQGKISAVLLQEETLDHATLSILVRLPPRTWAVSSTMADATVAPTHDGSEALIDDAEEEESKVCRTALPSLCASIERHDFAGDHAHEAAG